jgi:hypothetical protein
VAAGSPVGLITMSQNFKNVTAPIQIFGGGCLVSYNPSREAER